ncbi:hypothetical protein Ciccas_013595 [Cichlidogyrus casuarinus]|uniref:WW domain-containing protein n=1 Tax=Cichlidogyrus casuarinus TaxID=1844966 RepID=A0ABD2PLZ9_9PLAT
MEEEEELCLDDEGKPLPRGWELAFTSKGIRFYIDHVNQSTSWVDPREIAPAEESVDMESNSADTQTSLGLKEEAATRALSSFGPLPVSVAYV